MQGELNEFYMNLEFKCSVKCEDYFKMKDLFLHEMHCGLTHCKNFEKCGNYEVIEFNGTRCCSLECYNDLDRFEGKLLANHPPVFFNFSENSSDFQQLGNNLDFKFTQKKR